MKSHYKLLLALFLGGILGVVFHGQDLAWLTWVNQHVLSPIGHIFLRLIFMIVVPLLTSAIIMSSYELGQAHGLGKVAYKTLFFTVVTSICSVLIGVGLVNIFRPGDGLVIGEEAIQSNAGQLANLKNSMASVKPFSEILVDLFTKNPISSMARALEGEIVAVMIFALLFGVAMALSSKPGEKNALIDVLDVVMRASMKIVDFAMKIAPVAVFALVFNSAYKFGYDIFTSLLFYVVIVLFGLLIQQFVVYSLILKSFTRFTPLEFLKKTREVLLYAFSTASSNATLPKTLEAAELNLKLPPKVSRFVLTIGSTANQNGTALFEGVTVLFLAQIYGVDLSIGQQFFVVIVSVIAGIGTAGIPGGSLPPIMILLQAIGVPAESIGIVLGVDRLLDMARTTINVSGDLVIAAAVSNSVEEKT
jgi:DAACS family dicarboxylate/amino acid:cation (Na+ or H+) symporter